LPDRPTRVLITRPQPGAAETARLVTAMGLTPLVAPLQAVEPVPIRLPPPERVAGLVLTSRNAITAIPPAWHAVPVWAVGDATASRARAAGFGGVSSADGDAVALANLIARSISDPAPPPAAPPPAGRRPVRATLLLATGRGVGGPITAMLRQHGFRVIRRIAYRTRAAPNLPDTAIEALTAGLPLAVLFFSTEAARVFCRLVIRAGLAPAIAAHDAIAISSTAGMALRSLPWRAIRVAARPNQDAMLAMLR